MADNSAKDEALKFLREQRTAVISTVSPAGEPESAVITFIADDGFDLYFVTRKSSRKYKNILQSPKVSVVVGFDPEKPTTLQMQGVAETMPASSLTTIYAITKNLMVREFNWWPLLKVVGLDFVLLKVKMNWVRWFNFSINFESPSYEEITKQIVP